LPERDEDGTIGLFNYDPSVPLVKRTRHRADINPKVIRSLGRGLGAWGGKPRDLCGEG
jgi:hypothetical protein